MIISLGLAAFLAESLWQRVQRVWPSFLGENVNEFFGCFHQRG